MAKKTTKRQYLKELDRLEPPIRREFYKWVGERVGIARISDVERYIRAGTVEGVLQALDINQASIAEITETLRESYKSGGNFESASARVTFNIRSTDAEAWLRNNSSRFVTGIIESQQDAIQVALESGMRAGANPRTTALDIVGRTNSTGRRSGGIVGLSKPQASYVVNARSELRSGDTQAMRNYLTRTKRDKRFDATVLKAISEGRPLTAKQADTITGRYADRLLKLRGDAIARTESTAAFNAARKQAWDQSVAEGRVRQEFVESSWSATMDKRTRDSHQAMNGQTREFNQPFNSPTGALMLFPGDTSLGARAEDVVFCRCFNQIRADFIAQTAARF